MSGFVKFSPPAGGGRVRALQSAGRRRAGLGAEGKRKEPPSRGSSLLRLPLPPYSYLRATGCFASLLPVVSASKNKRGPEWQPVRTDFLYPTSGIYTAIFPVGRGALTPPPKHQHRRARRPGAPLLRLFPLCTVGARIARPITFPTKKATPSGVAFLQPVLTRRIPSAGSPPQRQSR